MHFILDLVWVTKLFATSFLVLVVSFLVAVVCLYDSPLTLDY